MWIVRSYGAWLEFVEDLVSHPSAEFPRRRVQDQLASTFDTIVSWNWEDADGSFGAELSHPIDGWPDDAANEAWFNGGRDLHPLIHWFRTTGDPRPMTIGRVPGSLVPAGGLESVRELSPHGYVQQLSIPYQLGPGHRAYVLGKEGDDFCDEAFELSRLIAPLLGLLWQQSSAAERCPCPTAADDWGLTGRELCVLQLLADGLTAQAIARRLGISARTVHCHLAHLYRKLGVADRMRAVLVAQSAGLIQPQNGDSEAGGPSPHLGLPPSS